MLGDLVDDRRWDVSWEKRWILSDMKEPRMLVYEGSLNPALDLQRLVVTGAQVIKGCRFVWSFSDILIPILEFVYFKFWITH